MDVEPYPHSPGSNANTVLREELECLLGAETAKKIFIVKHILLDILNAWDKRKKYE
jgi:hypothetical protein